MDLQQSQNFGRACSAMAYFNGHADNIRENIYQWHDSSFAVQEAADAFSNIELAEAEDRDDCPPGMRLEDYERQFDELSNSIGACWSACHAYASAPDVETLVRVLRARPDWIDFCKDRKYDRCYRLPELLEEALARVAD